jgi:hypothetical protein
MEVELGGMSGVELLLQHYFEPKQESCHAKARNDKKIVHPVLQLQLRILKLFYFKRR